jgi:DNA-binding transcriptional ArsR family regulator
MMPDRIFKLLADRNRLRILMLLDQRELCVCQIMAVLGISQPLVSKNLSLLRGADFLEVRREGKLVFYRLRRELSSDLKTIMRATRKLLKDDSTVLQDLSELRECMEIQRKTGRCDMETFLAYMRKKKGRRYSV